jgi:cell division protein FtsI (penicillin-binding protein 3)
VLFAIVGARLLQLQVIDSGWLSDQAEARRTNSITILAKRGTIYDRNGNVLAMSVDCKTIYCNPSEVDEPEKVAELIAQDLGGESSAYVDSLKGDGTFSYVYRQADEDKAEQLKEDLEEAGYEGVYFLDDTKRVYPYGSVANQVLGRVDVDGNGISGLEYEYDDILSGENGEMELEMGADGTPIAGSTGQVTEAKDGTDIIISIDVNIQQTAEETISEGVETYSADSGSVVVMDPNTGEILAMCSTPLCDFSDSSTITNESLQLKAVSSSYEPGSIFKIVTMAAGLESGTLTADTTFTVPASIQVGDDTVTDDDHRDYTMDMTVREILRRSSNVGAVMMAQAIGIDNFYDTVEKFGIGQKTGIDFPGEEAGILTSRDEFTTTNLGAMAFGQGVAFPMIQMVRVVGGIANGGVAMTPHFLVAKGGEEVDWGEGTRIVSEETASTITDVLRTVAQEGTGEPAQVAGYDVVGKTGTAEMASESGGGYQSGELMASMIGYANGDDPSVVVYVGLNGTPYLATNSSAYLFSTIMSEALGDMSVQPSS